MMVAVTLSSCFPSGDDEGARDLEYVVGDEAFIPSYVNEELLDNLSIDAEVSYPTDSQWKAFEVGYKIFEETEYIELLAGDRDVRERNEMPSAIEPTTQAVGCMLSDDSVLSLDSGSLYYATRAFLDRTYSNVLFSSGYTLRPDLGTVYNKGTLDGFNKDEAVNIVNELVHSLGIPVSATPNVYALDYETLMSEWEDFTLKDGSPATSWTEDDEAYLIEFIEEFDGLPVTNAGYIDREKQQAVNGGRIYSLVSQEGLIYFSCSGIFESVGSESASLISLDTAIQRVQDKYENIIITDPLAFSRISAALVPVCVSAEPLAFELVPGWVISGSQVLTISKGDDTFTQTVPVTLLINGITGKEIQTKGAA
jgi:hypothetical protein